MLNARKMLSLNLLPLIQICREFGCRLILKLWIARSDTTIEARGITVLPKTFLGLPGRKRDTRLRSQDSGQDALQEEMTQFCDAIPSGCLALSAERLRLSRSLEGSCYISKANTYTGKSGWMGVNCQRIPIRHGTVTPS